MLAGEMQTLHRRRDFLTQAAGPVARREAGIAALGPRMAGPVEARLARRASRRGRAGENLLEFRDGLSGLEFRRALADREPVPAADEIGQDAGRAGLAAAGLPGRLQREIAHQAA